MKYADCHPNREYAAKGLCKACYGVLWHKANRRRRLVEMRAYNKRYYGLNRKRLLAQQKMYDEINRERIVTHKRNRRQKDIQFRLAHNLRGRMRQALRGEQKTGSAIDDLGISISKFRLYIENQFEPGMTWDNYGEWHLDHVLPLASFDLTDRQQFLEAANWLNYQPLWAEENKRKGATPRVTRL